MIWEFTLRFCRVACLKTKESCQAKDKGGVIQTFKRTLSRKEKRIKHKGTEKDSGDETE